MNGERIGFPDALRGIAALAVVFGHYFGSFFAFQPTIAALLGVAPLTDPAPAPEPFSLIGDYGTILGQFGVGVFFIISGFVIPLSLTEGRRRFFVRRAFRIYPVYIVGFLIVVGFVALLTGYAGTQFPYSFWQVASHLGILTRGLFDFTRIDGISWTLEVELIFYLAMLLTGARLLAGGQAVYFIVPTVIAVAAAICMRLAASGHMSLTPGMELWASLMLVLGLGYNALLHGKVSRGSFLALHLYIAALQAAVWAGTADKSAFGVQWIVGYAVAMAVFALCFRWRAMIRPGPILRHFSSISYPLYVVHALPGYAVMYVLIGERGVPTLAAIGSALIATYSLAILLHVFVERPAIRFSKQPFVSARQWIAIGG